MTREQKMTALAQATQTRRERARIKRRVRTKTLSFQNALDRPSVQTMEIRKLLLCVPGVGRAKTQKYLRVLGISPSVQVQNLSESRRRQLEELVG